MTNRIPVFPGHNEPSPLHRHAGRITASAELAITYSGDDYLVEGSGTVRALPAMHAGATVFLRLLSTPVFVNSAKLQCPDSVSYVGQANDLIVARSEGDRVWRLYVLSNTSRTSLTPLSARVSLDINSPITSSDMTGQTSVYWVPIAAQRVSLWNGFSWVSYPVSALTLALDSTSGHTNYHQAGKLFDAFLADDGTGTVCLATGPAWTASNGVTPRGSGAGTTEIENRDGVQVNKNSITLRFGSASGNTFTAAANQARLVGTFCCTANGVTEDSSLNRLVSNVYCAEPRPMKVLETTATWAGLTATGTDFRISRGSGTNAFAFVQTLPGRRTRAEAAGLAANSAGGNTVITAIGLDSMTLAAPGSRIGFANGPAGAVFPLTASYNDFTGLGYHALNWLEYSVNGPTTTWYGTAGAPLLCQTGMWGEVLN